MANVLNVAMLVGATVGSMAFGVLTAYGMFRVGFAWMRPRQKSAAVVQAAPEAAL
ncbi:MAG TPA: hypothetical protein VG267_15190 [Terracidiphilus sp.]|nr:hypothetical protein [Terracidiphilus sp.]